jgi:hypothetical protein
VLKEPFSLAKGGHAILQRSTRSRERDARRFQVTFDDAVPAWQRRQKLEGWGRTYWRLALNPWRCAAATCPLVEHKVRALWSKDDGSTNRSRAC